MTSKEAFYRMRDTLIAEGYNYPEMFETTHIIEKDLEVLEIIKNNPYELQSVVGALDYEDYCAWWKSLKDCKPRLTETKFNLIKEWLER